MGGSLELGADRVNAYLGRIGLANPVVPDTDTLRTLHIHHLLAVPFENLDIHRPGHPIVLDTVELYKKIVENRRGGFCYELNGLFAALLISVGFDVDLLSARVRCEDGSFGREFDHLCLRINLNGGDRLSDVGFGEIYRDPLRLEAGLVQEQIFGTYRLLVDGVTWRYQALTAEGDWRTQYLFTLRPRNLPEFEGMCRFHQTSPESPFTKGRLCTRATPDGRTTLRDDRLIVTTDDLRSETPVPDDGTFQRLLRDRFGIALGG